jgi:hypothetical protein
MMKTFYEFIQEDFNSAGATQFPLAGQGIPRDKPLVVFYERVTARYLPILAYMKSFMSENATSSMKNEGNDWRAAVYGFSTGYDVFAWKASVQHHSVIGALDKSKDKILPKRRWLGLYNEANMLDSTDKVGDEWCFPFIIFQGTFVTNLNKTNITVLQDQTNVKGKFRFNDENWNKLVTKGDIPFTK